jgi:hypothetical protein
MKLATNTVGVALAWSSVRYLTGAAWDVLVDNAVASPNHFFDDHRGGLGRRSVKARQQTVAVLI